MNLTKEIIHDYIGFTLSMKDIEGIDVFDGDDNLIKDAHCNGMSYCAVTFHTLFDLGLISCAEYDKLLKQLKEGIKNE